MFSLARGQIDQSAADKTTISDAFASSKLDI